MTSEEGTIIAVLSILQFKHFLFDFVLQRPYEFFRNKGIYGHPGGIVHAGLHILGSLPALLVWGASTGLIVAILAAEFVIHYHLDWGKEQVTKRRTLSQAGSFLALGIDQLGHQMTYVGMLAALFIWG